MTERRVIEPASAAVLLCLLLFSASLSFSLGHRMPASSSGPAAGLREARDAGRIFAGLRSGLAAWLWLRTEDLHHGYYEDLSKEQELIPYYRVITWLDRKQVNAYDIGGYTLSLYGRTDEALAFLAEGRRNNPRSALLWMTTGQILLFRKADARGAASYMKRAIALEKDRETRRVYLNYLKLTKSPRLPLHRSGSSSGSRQPAGVPWRSFAD